MRDGTRSVPQGRWLQGTGVRTEARCGQPGPTSVGVLTYRLSLRCGVLFPKLSKLLNQEGALSAPCSPPAPSRGAPRPAPRHAGAGGTGRKSVTSDVTLRFATPHSSRRQALMSCRWQAAFARVERTDAKPSRAVLKTALTCGFLLPK
jgi:hypothetical protein